MTRVDGPSGALRRDLDAIDAREVEVVLGRRIGVDDPDLLAEGVEREGHGQLRSDRVAVGPGVGGEQEALAVQHFVANLTAEACQWRSWSSSGSSSPAASLCSVAGRAGARSALIS